MGFDEMVWHSSVKSEGSSATPETVSRIVVGVKSDSCYGCFDGAVHSEEGEGLDNGKLRCTEERHIWCGRDQGEIVLYCSDRTQVGVWDRRKGNE